MIDFKSRIVIFIASFSPMWLIVIGSYLIDDHSSLAIIICFLIILGIIASIVRACTIFAIYREGTNMEPVSLCYARDITHKYTTQIIAYVFFVLIDVTVQHNIFVIIALACFVSIIFSRTNMVLTNPALLLVGFRIYESKIGMPSRKIILLSKDAIKKGDEIRIKEIAPEIFIDKLKY